MLTKKYKDPYILIGGDFNGRPLETYVKQYKDLKLIDTPATRGDRVLDILACNFCDYLQEAGVTEPIVNERGHCGSKTGFMMK